MRMIDFLMDETEPVLKIMETIQNKTITLTPDQYSVTDEPKMIPEMCEVKNEH